MRETKIIAVANCKGGCGKTALSLNMSAALSKSGQKVLLVDNDPQGNTTVSMGIQPNKIENSLGKLMIQTIESVEFVTDVNDYIIHCDGIDVLPSNMLLAGLEIKLMSAYSREFVLKTILDSIKTNYDYIFIDCLPSLGLLTINALTAADSVLIPVESHYLCYEGLGLILDTIRHIQMKLNHNLKIEGIVFTMFQSRTKLCQGIQELVTEQYGNSVKIFESCVPFSIKAAEQPVIAKSIIEYAPKNPVAFSYKLLAKELMANDD